MVEDVEAIESEVGLPAYRAELQAIKGFWKQLQTLRKKATVDKKALPRYRSLLDRAIQQAQARHAQEDPLDGDDLVGACSSFWEFYGELRTQYGIAAIEPDRFPTTLEEWAEKWLPTQYQEATRAMSVFIEHPSRVALEGLKAAVTAMVKAYAEGKS